MSEKTRISRASFVKGSAAFAAVASLPQVALAEETAVPELYTTTVGSIKGDMTVAVLISGGEILDVKVTNCVDSAVVSDAAIADVPARIVAQQNVEVDVTTGATFTSLAIKNAVIDCLEQAGLDIDAFCKGGDALATEDKQAGSEESYDLVIVGSGFSGMACAIMAARSGAKSILVLEKEAYRGGSSRHIGGCISVMNGTTLNQQAGEDCTEDEFIAPLITEFSDEHSEERLREVYRICPEVFDYYVENGMPLNPNDWYRDEELGGRVVCFDCYGYSDYTWETGETGLYDSLTPMADALGIEVRLNSKVTGLVGDISAITGVTVEDKESVYTVNAKKVVLATGGFQCNQSLMDEYNASFAGLVAFAGAGCTGDGLVMCRELGAPIVGVGGAAGICGTGPVLGWYGPTGDLAKHPQVVFDADGNVLGAEQIGIDELAKIPGSCGYGLIDTASQYRDRCAKALEEGFVSKFETLADAAAEWGISEEALTAGCAEYGVETAPFYGIVQHPCNILTLPGPKIDQDFRVCAQDGTPVENLYAVGVLMFGNMFGDTADEPGVGSWTATFSSVTISNCTGTIVGKALAEELA